MNTPSAPSASPLRRKRIGLRWIFGGGGAVLMMIGGLAFTAFLLTPHHEGPESNMTYPGYENNVRAIGEGLIEYHKTQGTDTAPYPSDIRQLDGMGITSNIDKLLSVHPEDAGDWLYFWAADSENPSAPLLISPELGDERPGHVLLTVDGVVRIVDPAFVAEAARSSLEPPYKVHAPLIK